MDNITLVEGRLSFNFVAVDFAEKYDNWRHYRNSYNSACGSSKAVDFIVSKDNVAWLIEVKDYRRHQRTKPSDLAEEVMIKVRDTMSGLVSASFVAREDDEKNKARLALSRRRLRVALHLEQPRNPSKLFPRSVDPANLSIKLNQLLKFADYHPLVVDISTFPTEIGQVASV